jgi:6-phosphogluconate dehydrogenase
VATPAITAALFARFVSRQEDSPAMQAVAALRNQFGGHAIRTTAPEGGDAAGAGGGSDPEQAGAAEEAGAGSGTEPAES